MARKITAKVPPKLFKETQALIKNITQNLKGDFISYWTSGNSRIVGDDIVAFYEVLKGEKRRIHFIYLLKVTGGQARRH